LPCGAIAIDPVVLSLLNFKSNLFEATPNGFPAAFVLELRELPWIGHLL